MPELPEVETVKNVLKRHVLNRRIIDAKIYWNNIIAYPTVDKFKEKIKNQLINDILRRGKYLVFSLDDYFLLSHLRMEGKYFFRNRLDPRNKHEHVIFELDDGTDLRYHDTRKFGKMYLIEKSKINIIGPLKDLGLEPWDKNLNVSYLRKKLKHRPIKTELLDQSIITGIGNIYADEILFLSKVNPNKTITDLTDKNLEDIIKYTRTILDKAIKLGGTTIRSYTSEEGVHGRFQEDLLVHTKDYDPLGHKIKVEKINGRSTFYCPICQGDLTNLK